MGFYERLENLRKEAGIGQGKLEKELQIANGSISKWKNRTPKYATLEKIANYFNVSIDYLIYGTEHNDIKSNDSLNKAELFCGTSALRNEISKDECVIYLLDEPEIHLHSKVASELIKMMKNIPDDDLNFLLDTAKRISPKDEPDNIVPFSQFPDVTNKDINDFAARNAKRKFTREEIAEMIYEMRKDD